MAQYQSSHSGQEYDEAVTRVLQGTCGIQGVKVNGTSLQPDSNNKVNITSQSLMSENTFVPNLIGFVTSGTANNPTYTTNFSSCWYMVFGNMCYISINVSYNVTTPGNDYMGLSSLPYSAYSEGGINWPLSVCCMYSSSADFTNNIGARIVGERIEFMNNNGKSFINCSDFSNSSCVFNIAGFYRVGV